MWESGAPAKARVSVVEPARSTHTMPRSRSAVIGRRCTSNDGGWLLNSTVQYIRLDLIRFIVHDPLIIRVNIRSAQHRFLMHLVNMLTDVNRTIDEGFFLTGQCQP